MTAAASSTPRSIQTEPQLAAGFGSNNGVIAAVALFAGLLAAGVVTQIVVSQPTDSAFSGAYPAIVPAGVFTLVAAAASASIMFGALKAPYRQGTPLGEMSARIDLGQYGELTVADDTAGYVEGLQTLAPLLDQDARTCFVDLTGSAPLSVLVLDGTPAAHAWMAGAYPGSNESAEVLLESSTCLDGSVALLESVDGRRRIERPAILDARELVVLGTVPHRGYVEETQVLSQSIKP